MLTARLNEAVAAIPCYAAVFTLAKPPGSIRGSWGFHPLPVGAELLTRDGCSFLEGADPLAGRTYYLGASFLAFKEYRQVDPALFRLLGKL